MYLVGVLVSLLALPRQGEADTRLARKVVRPATHHTRTQKTQLVDYKDRSINHIKTI